MLPPDCAAAGLESRPHGSDLVHCATAGLEPRPLTLPGGGVLVYCYDMLEPGSEDGPLPG